MFKGFRVDTLKDFLQLADMVSTPKFVDQSHNLAFFYLKKRIEFKIKSKEEAAQLASKGFIAGEEIEIMDPF